MVATLKDVSLLAGVSLTTVSHVVNDTRPVSAELRERVEAAIRQTGYTPNTLARSLKMSATHTIGVAVQDIRNPHFTEIVYALEVRAREHGFTILLSDFGDEPAREREALQVFLERRIDGLVIAPTSQGAEALALLRRNGVPCVQIDRIADPAFDSIAVTNVAATRRLTAHLCGLGHRRIAMLTGRAGLSTTRERLAGYRRALVEAGLPIDPGLIVEGGSESETARVATHLLMELDIPPTALVAGNNLKALGALRALRERGLDVPGDIALVCFDDFPWADLFEPRLTCMAQPCRAIGERAVERLLERIANPDLPPRHLRLAAEFRQRSSCGSPLSIP
jgi:LacI family transcriptional regulator